MTDQILVEKAIELVTQWLESAEQSTTARERRTAARLKGVVADPDGVRFAMAFVDRVIRAEDPKVAAKQLASLVRSSPVSTQLVPARQLPGFLSWFDKLLLRVGARLAPLLPRLVMPLAQRRLRQLVGHLVVDADPQRLRRHLRTRRAEGFRLNVNLLGEAVLGQREADRRLAEALRLLDEPDIDYVSVKLSALVPRLNHWDYDHCVRQVSERLRVLFDYAKQTSPPTFINLDMEEYHDLELTLTAFMTVLDEPAYGEVSAGIVLQAYLPDSFDALRRLVEWASADAVGSGGIGSGGFGAGESGAGGRIKVRLVKGANLAMERVEAAMHGWEQAPYATKAETDANYKRCLDWVLTPERTKAVRVGLASHNLFDVAWGVLLAKERGVSDRVEIEMLEGMAPTFARLLRQSGEHPLLYTPVVANQDFDVAISYLLRRLEENSSKDNFIRHLFGLQSGSDEFQAEAAKFRAAVAGRANVASGPRRTQVRGDSDGASLATPNTTATTAATSTAKFSNTADSDPALPTTRIWATEVAAKVSVAKASPTRAPAVRASATASNEPSSSLPLLITQVPMVDEAVERAHRAQQEWASKPVSERRQVLHAIANELSRRRGDLIAVMMSEGRKTFAEADSEVSEAIDFARYYGDKALELTASGLGTTVTGSVTATTDSASFMPLGVITVTPPWNFPVAIPAGGVLASLAAGNAVLLKPAPETPQCAAVVAECCWAAGVAADVLQLLRTPDDEVGQRLITHPKVGAVILTGAYETAQLFRSWRPDLRLFAETSGKNAIVITPSADIDLAVADLVYSAFGHCGQKCSAASLAICVGQAYESPRFRRQLMDAVTSLEVGEPTNLSTDIGPLIAEPEGKLARALTTLEPGESWLVEPRRVEPELSQSQRAGSEFQRLGGSVWAPGVRLGVRTGSWFHQTECFGPVLGVMHAASLEEAIELQNSTPFGLTGGIHSLDPDEVERWIDAVEVGNAYVNRAITGAIVQRQPFGGWKRSGIGPGAKAGGPNYVSQLGTWLPVTETPAAGTKTGGGAATSLDTKWLTKWLEVAKESDKEAWQNEFGVEHDPTGLFCESNVFRYRPLNMVAIRSEISDSSSSEVGIKIARAQAAAEQCGVRTVVSTSETESSEEFTESLASLTELGVSRVRVIGTVSPDLRTAANELNIHIADDPITQDGRLELRHYLREQAISKTLHRYGNLI